MADAPVLEHLFTITASTSMAAAFGTRVIIEASSGTFEGERLRGTVVGPGGDWVTIRPDGSMKVDVRLLLQTDDGASILMTYTGVATDRGARIRTAPLFETADERYAWLNDVVAVGVGAIGDGTVTYDVFAVA